MSEPVIRPRRREDLPRLAEVLAEQQPTSGYPYEWPLSFPVEHFIAREHELGAWVVEVDGSPAGHISIQSAAGATGAAGFDGAFADLWTRGHDRPVDQLAIVTCLYTATHLRGHGAGSALLGTAVEWLRAHDLGPCLDVLPTYSEAVAFYERHGWIRAGTARPPWLPPHQPDAVAMILPG